MIPEVLLLDVDAPEICASGVAVDGTVERDERGDAFLVERRLGDRDEVDVADAWDVVAEGERACDEEITDRARLGQTRGERANDRAKCAHAADAIALLRAPSRPTGTTAPCRWRVASVARTP